VVPLPGGVGVPLAGPPQPELEPQIRKIKACLYAMLGSMALKVVSGTLLIGLIQVLLSCMNLILNTFMGIFLLAYDPSVGKMHKFLMANCFQSCAEGCTHGMGCLMPFVLCNLITVVLDILIGPTLPLLFAEIPVLVQPAKWPNAFVWIVHAAFVLSVTFALIAQCLAAHFGWKLYKEAIGVSGGAASGGYGPLGGGSGVPPMGVGRQLGGGGGLGGQPASSQGRGYTPPTVRQAPANEPFKPFSGQGQRLGGR